MPKIAINWETTTVSFYKFVCKDPSILYSYVGHTTNFSKRKGTHKKCCTNSEDKSYNLPIYVFIRQNGGWSNWDMVQTHSQICKDNLEARQIEQELLEQQQLKLNTNNAYLSLEQRKINKSNNAKEYREKNKEQIAIKRSEYYEKNKEQITIKVLEDYEKNKERIRIYGIKYREKNREQIANKKAEAYQKQKTEKLNIKI